MKTLLKKAPLFLPPNHLLMSFVQNIKMSGVIIALKGLIYIIFLFLMQINN